MVIICDCMYRSAIAAIYSCNKLGEEIIAVSTCDNPYPPSFNSRYIKERFVLPKKREAYKKELLEICKKYNRPVILPMGVFTLNILSENINEFKEVADFTVSEKGILDLLNDKKRSKELAISVGIKVPKKSESFPLIVKPFCGEKFGLKASERYKIAKNAQELNDAVEKYKKYDPSPLIEEYIEGYGVGVSLIIGNDGEPKSAFCHRRISEYPSNGGPSSSLVTFRDDRIVSLTVDLFKKAEFRGIAMAEYKVKNGEYYFLEVNPRIWGSFAATYKTDSDFISAYLASSRNEEYVFSPSYKIKKIKFVPNIVASAAAYLKAGKIKLAFASAFDAVNPFVPNAIFKLSDPIPAIKDIFRKRG